MTILLDRMKEQIGLTMITGATAGIGLALAKQLASQSVPLILTGRRQNRLVEIKKSLSEQYPQLLVETLNFDVSNKEQLDQVLNQNKSLLERVEVLVNNAGFARGLEPMQEAHVSDWEAMIDTNVKGLLYMTRALLPSMIQNKKGHIVNLGSVAGRWVYPGGGVYCATKFAVRAISEGLRMDLIGQPIRVTNIEPGMVETEFSIARLQDEKKAKDVYKGMRPLRAEDIADTIWWCLQRPAHVNIQEIVIFPTDQAAIGQVHRL